MILGGLINGVTMADGRFAGGPFDWATPFALLCGVGLVAGYALLGATWLIWKTEGELAAAARRQASVLLFVVLAFIAAVSVWTPLAFARIADRWFTMPNIIFLAPVPLLTAAAAYAGWRALARGDETTPFIASAALFLLCFFGLAISTFPYLVPPDLTIFDAAAAPESQIFSLIGVVFMLPVIFGYVVFVYWTFRGKVRTRGGVSLATLRIDISEVVADFPEFRVAVVIAEGLDIGGARPPELAQILADAGRRLPDELVGHRAFRRFPGSPPGGGPIAPSASSGRAIVPRSNGWSRTSLPDATVPAINAFVDAYNAVSLAHVMPLGADDLDRVERQPRLSLQPARRPVRRHGRRRGRRGERRTIRRRTARSSMPTTEKILCRRWNWRQDMRSLVTPLTRRAVVTVQSIGVGDLDVAVADLSTSSGASPAAKRRSPSPTGKPGRRTR